MALLIRPNGESQEIQPKGKLTLQDLQQFVGGYIEFVRLPDGRWLAVDEDGKPKRLPVNVKATAMAALPGEYIVGSVVILSARERRGVG